MPTTPSTTTPSRRGFTLVELMVVLVILSILGSLTLAGLNVARRRGKAEKTRSTISKLNGVIMSHAESFVRRSAGRVLSGTTTPANELGYMYDLYLDKASTPPVSFGPKSVDGTWPAGTKQSRLPHATLAHRRLLMTLEMPDSWSDVKPNAGAVTNPLTSTIPQYARTGVVRGYAAYKQSVTPDTTAESAECLFMVVTRSGFDPYAIEQFRTDEIGDTDGDGACEFLDHSGKPIIFLRWAPGFTPYSARQFRLPVDPANPNGPAQPHDPMDLQGVDQPGYALIPLIASGGEDGLTGLQVAQNGWLPLSLLSVVTSGSNVGAPDPANPTAYRDNITNHDFSR